MRVITKVYKANGKLHGKYDQLITQHSEVQDFIEDIEGFLDNCWPEIEDEEGYEDDSSD